MIFIFSKNRKSRDDLWFRGFLVCIPERKSSCLVYRTQFYGIGPAGLGKRYTERINENIAGNQLFLANERLFDILLRSGLPSCSNRACKAAPEHPSINLACCAVGHRSRIHTNRLWDDGAKSARRYSPSL